MSYLNKILKIKIKILPLFFRDYCLSHLKITWKIKIKIDEFICLWKLKLKYMSLSVTENNRSGQFPIAAIAGVTVVMSDLISWKIYIVRDLTEPVTAIRVPVCTRLCCWCTASNSH